MRELKFNEVDAVIGGALGADLSSGADLVVAPSAAVAETVWTRVLRDLGLPAHDATRS